MQRVLLVAAAVALLQTAAAAQMCEGRPSFAAGGMQVGAGAEFVDDANSFGGSIGIGVNSGVYGRAVIGPTFHRPGSSTFNVGGSVGYQVPIGRTRVLQLCPTGSLNFKLGRYSSGQLGLMMGAALSSGSIVDIRPNGGLFLGYRGGSFGLLMNLGLGFVLNSRMAVTPAVIVPFALEDGGLLSGPRRLNLSIALNFGTPR